MNHSRAFVITTCAAFWALVALTCLPPLLTPSHVLSEDEIHPPQARCYPPNTIRRSREPSGCAEAAREEDLFA